MIAQLCLCWLIWCGAPDSNTEPLAFGMTQQEASAALGVPLVRYSAHHGSEILIGVMPAGIPGYYPTKHTIALQFRRGRLTGWKKDWDLRQHRWF
jgi:hypothetical protein